jgi:hypothetical protein
MAQQGQKFNVASNPHRSGSSSRPPATKKGRKGMAKTGTKKRTAPNGGPHRKAKSKSKNPATMHRKKRRNPTGLGATIGSPKDLITGGVAGLASAIATRQLPQLVLSTGNTGVEGYAANLLTALVATWAAGTFAGPAAGRGALIGGMVILLDRVLSEQVSPISQYLSLSGVGDATAYSKLGTIRQGYYSHPNLQNPDGSMYVPDPVTDAAVQAVVARYPQLAAPVAQAVTGGHGGGKMGAVNPSSLRRHTANGMLLSSRFQGRFNQ